MIKTLTLATALLATISVAEARPRHRATAITTERIALPHPVGCPRVAFCGCGVAVKVFGQARRDLFRAAAWFQFPRATPATGMVAVRRHHVMYILDAHGNGTARVYDPNSGRHRTHEHTRSLAGYRVVNPRG